MPATRLATQFVEKPWGRHHLWPGFADPAPGSDPVGEVWFQAKGDTQSELLVKYLFTSERLSVQVHPDDAAAQKAGYPRGKDEAWVVLAAEPDSTIALGLKEATTREHLRAAALDGTIEQLMDWKPVKAGDVIYSAAGTIHAIGAGITLVEIQQNVDLTYRLYDYGRPRELHLDAGIAVAEPVPFVPPTHERADGAGRTILTEGEKFVIERWTEPRSLRLPEGVEGWFVPLTGQGTVDGQEWKAGEGWAATGSIAVDFDEAEILIAYPGSRAIG
jgi:mannose-6-phosphate isomerase